MDGQAGCQKIRLIPTAQRRTDTRLFNGLTPTHAPDA